MAVRVTCPSCGTEANVEEQSLGRRGRCKKCGHVFALARPGGEAASAISGDASAWKRSSEPASPVNLPEQFGRYRIMKPLGQGGMGAVYLAHDTKLNRPVALKVPYFSPADGPQAVQRFEREARASATLDHPNLCQVFDVGEIDGIHYLTMPYIEGKPLSEAMTRGQTVTEAQAAAVVRKIALALQEAHEKGIIHRDLKPGNIMVNRRRELIVMDFGLARVVDGDDKPITRTGHVLGTALYMAPEQAAGDVNAIGPACDVYSLGVILYELLTGQRPFEGPWSLVIGLKNVKDPDPPASHRPDLGAALNAICLKAIAKNPKDRYATMAEFAGALNGFLSGPSDTESVVPLAETATPISSPESLVAQMFEGLVSQEVTSLRGVNFPARTNPARPKGATPPVPRRTWIMVAAVALILGVVIVRQIGTPGGTDLITAHTKDNEISNNGKDKRPIQEPDFGVTQGDADEKMDGDEEGKPMTVAQGPPANDAPVGEGGQSSKPAIEAGKAAPTGKGKEAELAVAGTESKEATKSPSTKSTTSPKNGRNVAKKGAGTTNPFPADAVLFGGNRYMVFREALRWHEARTKCEAMGGHLAVVGDESENRFLTSLVSAAGLEFAWLGATDELVEGRWVWVNGMEKSYENWDRLMNQPNNGDGQGEDHLLLRVSRNGAWWDSNNIGGLEHLWGFICEWESRPARMSAPKKGASPKKASEDADITSRTLGMKLKLIPAGEFLMGSDETDPDAEDKEKVDGKKHRVRITKPFYMGATEVTVGQFREFVEKTAYKTDVEKNSKGGWGWNVAKGTYELSPNYSWRAPGFPQKADHPVTLVSWNDAVAFCNWLSTTEKRWPCYDNNGVVLSAGNGYRLPTEAEWEYSCRAGRTSRYSSGDYPESLATVGNVADGTAREKYPAWTQAIKARDGYALVAPVGQFLPNAFGLHDMHGNVWEWCADWYNPKYYSEAPITDPFNSTQAESRVRRGGCWDNDRRLSRASSRVGYTSDQGSASLGFRVARDPDDRAR
jgi:predicted Zn finger-like uncharacterized protein